MVVFDDATDQTDSASASFNRRLVGRGGGLPDTYGMDACQISPGS